MNKLINELMAYGIRTHLVEEDDRIYVTNRLLELFGLMEFTEEQVEERDLAEILRDMCKYAYENGIIEDNTVTATDLFDTKIMGLLTPPPSVVRKNFREHYAQSSKAATDYYYQFSKATNYIRTERIAKDEKWVTETEYGPIDITINLSKPEKDPRDIAKAGQAKKSGYPSCLLCVENEGYAGHFSHPARQNHRVIPITLDGQEYFLQYSPYVYYNEHCIIFNRQHTPMKIDRAVFKKILEFVKLFPHYTAGSNADLPIVGGSILSHDHFQGGGYVFAMAKAPYDRVFTLPGYEDLTAGIVKWPMSVIRLRGKDIDRMTAAADHILSSWRGYTDEESFVFSETDGVPHNTITPIARMHEDMYELDLVLRNNITTPECPWGVYHPSADLHHIKKENIGLIEVMGLAVLPARLKKEMAELEEYILNHKDLRSNETLEKHADWVDEWIQNYEINETNIHAIVQQEISKVFVKVLECAGVYKRTEDGQKGFDRFIASL
ncbi:UDP-glucose--hexose-1-phosphate uridylyltransferase [Agathobacter ruminis]|uniref:Galactose-1-phosphate uridylyltransferase n=1 Tax=Agathobacter ruminis TaxID=1712665 RepID=A0A2G3E3P6_9FIRM|nr:UDP-glucose--hexose-1-phosphate uridylyltransferase [Agathobacter ruminis]MDC7300254.1 UDP-glucose--hexose-1-phosphate uridylyltransferase [Agathobacter ruminis]PHU37879.1 UDP-glucose--hexose-1-phosphate uridylyltransferase [Agathobacter ruminis]